VRGLLGRDRPHRDIPAAQPEVHSGAPAVFLQAEGDADGLGALPPQPAPQIPPFPAGSAPAAQLAPLEVPVVPLRRGRVRAGAVPVGCRAAHAGPLRGLRVHELPARPAHLGALRAHRQHAQLPRPLSRPPPGAGQPAHTRPARPQVLPAHLPAVFGRGDGGVRAGAPVRHALPDLPH
jgi:hypothetical protein